MQTAEVEITAELGTKMGLTKKEFRKIVEILGRTPNYLELSIFSLSWSERSSKKSFNQWLDTLPRQSNRIPVLENRQNGCIIDLGDELGCVIQLQKHSAPFPENLSNPPYDLLTKGAKPIGAIASFSLSALSAQRQFSEIQKEALELREIAGEPFAIGAFVFHNDPFDYTMANSMSIGIVNKEEVKAAVTVGPRDPVFLVSIKNGPKDLPEAPNRFSDHQAIDNAAPSRKMDETHLEDSILELIKTHEIVGIKNVGSGGILSALAEMCSNSGNGMCVHLDRIAGWTPDQEPLETLQSGNRHCSLVAAKPGKTQQLIEAFEKCELEIVEVGEVSDRGNLEFLTNGGVIAAIPLKSLVEVPHFDRELIEPGDSAKITAFKLKDIPSPKSLVAAAQKLFASLNIQAKNWIHAQRSPGFGTDNDIASGPSDAIIFHDPNRNKSLVAAMSSKATCADPFVGGMLAVSEAVRSIICSGGVPIALGNCFLVGDPDNSDAYFQFVNAVKGIGEACRKFDLPVTGNHIHYSDQIGAEGAENLTVTTVGMLGMLDDAAHFTTLNFKAADDLIYMLGNIYNDLGSSEYLRVVQSIEQSPAPHLELQEEYDVHQHTLNLIRSGIVRSAHNVSKGGLFACLMESAIAGGHGFNIETVETFRKDCFLFGESQSRVVLTISPENEDAFQNYLISRNVSFTKLGEVLGQEVIIDEVSYGLLSDWKALSESSFAQLMNH